MIAISHRISSILSSFRAVFVVLIWPISSLLTCRSDQIFYWCFVLLSFIIGLYSSFASYIRRALVLFSLDRLFSYLSYLLLVSFIIPILLPFHLFIEHLFHETYYNCLTFITRVVFSFLIILLKLIYLAILSLPSAAAFFCWHPSQAPPREVCNHMMTNCWLVVSNSLTSVR